MIYIAIDQGESTGLAVYDSNQELITLMTIRLGETLDMVDSFNPDFIILEKLPVNLNFLPQAKREWASLLEYVFRNFENRYTLISPGHWKPLAKSMNWKCPQAATRHSHDAYSMLRYYLYIRNKDDTIEGKNVKVQSLDSRVWTDGSFRG